jgi:hypothetical protein
MFVNDDLHIATGQLVASGFSAAVHANYNWTLPAAYLWLANAENAPLPGPYFTSADPTPNNAIVNSKWLLVSDTDAVVDDVIISGVETVVLMPQVVTLHVATTISDDLNDVDAATWFADLPAGLTVVANAIAGSHEIVLSVSGTPLAAAYAYLNLTIPASVLASGVATAVAHNPNAQFEILSWNVFTVLEHFGTWTGSGTVSGTIDAAYSGFTGLMLNGVLVDPSHYTLTDGSTIITLTGDHLGERMDGTHVYRALFADGHADLELKVARTQGPNPEPTPGPPHTPGVESDPARLSVGRQRLARTGVAFTAIVGSLAVALFGTFLLKPRRRA